jgi:tetratricopeptide (TPR) repeat protein
MAMVAHAELDRGNYSRARSWARKALALDPGLPEAYAYLGFVEDQAGRRDEALTALPIVSAARARRPVRQRHPDHRRSGTFGGTPEAPAAPTQAEPAP